MGLYAHIFTFECAAGSPTTAAAAAHEHFGTKLALLAGRGRTRHKKHAAGHCLWDNLIIWASMLVSALLNVPLGALRQQAAGEHFGTEMALLAGCGAHKTQKTRSRALSAGQPHHMGLYAHICTSECAAGSPTPAGSRRALWH